MRWFVLRLCADFFFRCDDFIEAIAATRSKTQPRHEVHRCAGAISLSRLSPVGRTPFQSVGLRVRSIVRATLRTVDRQIVDLTVLRM
jgi:hypothetical protein